MSRKTWAVVQTINAGEYEGTILITAERLEQVGECKVVADGVEIELDEEILRIEEQATTESPTHNS